MNFPEFISFTLTNACNLRCKMCGQWSETGYVKNRIKNPGSKVSLEKWKELVDEISSHKIRFILIRGGEPFLYSGIMELVKYIDQKEIPISIDTNGTILEDHLEELSKIKNLHITFSVDGPEELHDIVRGEKGGYNKIKENIELLTHYENKCGNKISKSICFTISKHNYHQLGEIPDVARSLKIDSINIVPFYYFSSETGLRYEKELEDNFGCSTYSWKGFFSEGSGVDTTLFLQQLKIYKKKLNGVSNFPYMPLSEQEYTDWFSEPYAEVGIKHCNNVENLIDIQPDGSANFCIDFPDYSFGNIKENSISEIWNSHEAEVFRNYIRKKPLAVCYKCGAKYITELKE